MCLDARELVDLLQRQIALFPEEPILVFVQMNGEYTDCLHVDHEFHDDWKDRYPEGRHTITLRGAA